MEILIVEDEYHASQKLIRLLKQIDFEVKVVDVLQSVESAVSWFANNVQPELIFMDIQLEDGLCFEIFENCQINTPVIFTTAFDEFTLKAFKVNSIDYLLKPIDRIELNNAIEKFRKIHNITLPYSRIESVVNQLKQKYKSRFLLKIGEHYRSVLSSDISCFYIKDRINYICVNTGRYYPIDYSLDTIEKLVDTEKFFRINRNFIVNFYAIKDIVAYSSSRLKVIITDWNEDLELLVSRERVSDFKEWMDR